ncbi:MAG: hypothetical protein ACR2JW_16125 [Thermomicrobiales bacterium]
MGFESLRPSQLYPSVSKTNESNTGERIPRPFRKRDRAISIARAGIFVLTQADIEDRIEQAKREFSEFANEVDWIHRDVVSHHYPVAYKEPPYGFHHTCHAYMMLAFAWIDSMSAFWTGGRKQRNPSGIVVHPTWSYQTERMVTFLDAYHTMQTDVNRVAVEMWRHTLMRESKSREIEDRTGRHYYWTLLWEMDAARHYTMISVPTTETGKPYVTHMIQIGLLPLVTDLGRAFRSYWHDLRTNADMQRAYARREAEIPAKSFPL